MTATPTPEASAAPITENSAHTGPDHPAPDGPDRFDQGRKLVIASAQGAQDADEWVAEARDTGVTVMRLTDVVASSLEDCVDDPERKYEQMDSKARAAVDAGMGIVLDLSFIRDAAIRAGRNPYRTDFDWEPYVTSLLTRPFPAGGTYGTSEHVIYISLPGEPHVDWGDDPNEKADSAEDLIAFYQRLARVVRRAGVDRPLAAAGFVQHTADGNGTEAGLDITAVYSLVEVDVCTTHAYDQESLDALLMLTRYAHALGKPFIMEETGRDASDRSDVERADWLARVQKACATAGVDGVGVWEVQQSRGFDVQPPQHPLTAAAVRRMVDAVIPEGISVQKDPVTHGEHAATPDEAVSPDAPGADPTGTSDAADSAGSTGSADDAEGGDEPGEVTKAEIVSVAAPGVDGDGTVDDGARFSAQPKGIDDIAAVAGSSSGGDGSDAPVPEAVTDAAASDDSGEEEGQAEAASQGANGAAVPVDADGGGREELAEAASGGAIITGPPTGWPEAAAYGADSEGASLESGSSIDSIESIDSVIRVIRGELPVLQRPAVSSSSSSHDLVDVDSVPVPDSPVVERVESVGERIEGIERVEGTGSIESPESPEDMTSLEGEEEAIWRSAFAGDNADGADGADSPAVAETLEAVRSDVVGDEGRGDQQGESGGSSKNALHVVLSPDEPFVDVADVIDAVDGADEDAEDPEHPENEIPRRAWDDLPPLN